VREELERANAVKTEFLSRTSHELKTPLNSILGFAQLLELDETEPERAKQVGHILKGGRHLLGLIDDLLSLSRVERDELPISPEPVNVHLLLEEVIALVEPLAASNRVTIRAEREGEQQQYVTADQQRLKQVLLNLLSNALKYNRPGGQVRIGCQLAGSEQVRVDVFNTGEGLTLAEQQKIFIPFERLAHKTAGVEGTGLGLSLSRRLAELMGGELAVSSEVGVGTTFSLVLPRADDVGSTSARAAIPQRSSIQHGDGRHVVVLYIEDNPANYRLVEQTLALRGSTEVLVALQGSIGIELTRSTRPDLVMLDLHLPDMPGEQVLAALKGDPRTARIPVLVLSADVTPGHIARLIEAGAEAYLTKPLDVSSFLRTVEHIVGEAAGVTA
jgi:CheY-like chemotaxis protein/two-component sensor histidine kinase